MIVYFTILYINIKRRNMSLSTSEERKKYIESLKSKADSKKTQEIDISNIKLSEEQLNLAKLIEDSNDNFFVTGKAGTGKSVLLQYIKHTSEKKLVVAAPTGVAALNVGGETIHSLFKVPPDFIAKNSLILSRKIEGLLKRIDMVIIDEISMVRADLMDAIDSLLRQAKKNDRAFGGVQVIMFGDVYQLPPIVTDRELFKYFEENFGGYYFFNADVWKDTKLNVHELTNIFRQKDEKFRLILNAIRTGSVNQEILNELNKRTLPTPDTGIVTLATTNNSVNEINKRHLVKLDGKAKIYEANITGDLSESSFPTDEYLNLKEGAQVIFIKNDKENRWVNGTIGVVEKLEDDDVIVNINGISVPVDRVSWEKVKYEYNEKTKKVDSDVTSTFTQFPLRLAWAITIHKSQGQTYTSVSIDLGYGSFAHGQTYVALSRCESLEGLYLRRRINPRDIIVDQKIIKFMARQD